MTTREEVLAAAKEAGFYVDEDGSMWEHNDYVEQDGCGMQDIGDKVNHLYAIAFEAGSQAEREECAKLLESSIKKAGEVMRERSINVAWNNEPDCNGPIEMGIRALPAVTLDDLKGGA